MSERSPKARGLLPSDVDASEEWLKNYLLSKDRRRPLYTLFGLYGISPIYLERWPSGWACGKYYCEYGKVNWDVRYKKTAKDAVEEWLRRGYNAAKDILQTYSDALDRIRDDERDGKETGSSKA